MDRSKRVLLVVIAVAILGAVAGAAIWSVPRLAQGVTLADLFGGLDRSSNASTDPAFAPLLHQGIGYVNPDANCGVPTEVLTKPITPPLRIFSYTPKDFSAVPPGNPPVVFHGFNVNGPIIISISGYSGPILLRGLNISTVRSAGNSQLAFGQPGGRSVNTLAFKVAPNQFRRIELKPPTPGCYVLQVDGTDFVEDVYLRAG